MVHKCFSTISTNKSINLQFNNCLWLQVFPTDMNKDSVVLFAARASRVENQDAIDASIVNMLSDPKEVFIMIYILVWNIICIHAKYAECLTF